LWPFARCIRSGASGQSASGSDTRSGVHPIPTPQSEISAARRASARSGGSLPGREESSDCARIPAAIKRGKDDGRLRLLEEIEDEAALPQNHPLYCSELAGEQVGIPFDPVHGREVLPENLLTGCPATLPSGSCVRGISKIPLHARGGWEGVLQTSSGTRSPGSDFLGTCPTICTSRPAAAAGLSPGVEGVKDCRPPGCRPGHGAVPWPGPRPACSPGRTSRTPAHATWRTIRQRRDHQSTRATTNQPRFLGRHQPADSIQHHARHPTPPPGGFTGTGGETPGTTVSPRTSSWIWMQTPLPIGSATGEPKHRKNGLRRKKGGQTEFF
jgi:hypothetical protein